MERDVTVHIFRHGQAQYRQDFTDIYLANDLTEAGITKVASSAKELIKRISRNISSPVIIGSSPTGRTLQTARIIAEVAESRSITLRKRNNSIYEGIIVLPKLQDQINFDFSTVKILVEGGNIEFEGQRFSIDKSVTNPHSLSFESYSVDILSTVPIETLNLLPKQLLDKAFSIESAIKSRQRLYNILVALFNSRNKRGEQHFVLVSHSVLTSDLVNFVTSGSKERLEPGEFLSLSRENNNLLVQVGNFSGVIDYTKDLFNFFTTHK